jgi:hypothetical protein
VPVITISQIIFIVYEDVGKLECKELPPDPKKNKYVKLKLLVTIHWNVIMLIPIDKLSNVLSTFGCACGVWKPSLNLCDCHHSLPCIVGGPLCVRSEEEIEPAVLVLVECECCRKLTFWVWKLHCLQSF